MLPETADGRSSYITYRDHRSMWRKNDLEFHGIDALKARSFWLLALDADLAGLKEQVDFMQSEGYLSPEQVEAAENVFGWAKVLLSTIPEVSR